MEEKIKVLRQVEVETESYQVGDKITFTLTDGEEVEALAVKQQSDGMIFVLVDCLRQEYEMNFGETNQGGWEASFLRRMLNAEIFNRFPESMRANMVAFENGDYLRLPTEKEVFGENCLGEKEPSTVARWEPMEDVRNVIACAGSKSGYLAQYWLQDSDENTYVGFVRPVFKLRGEDSHE